VRVFEKPQAGRPRLYVHITAAPIPISEAIGKAHQAPPFPA
jgi:hypothetical protein